MKLVLLTLFAVSCSTPALCQNIPKQLFGRSVAVTHVAQVTHRDTSGRVFTIPVSREGRIYFSNVGRIFVRSSLQVAGRTITSDIDPGATGQDLGRKVTVRFVGKRLIADLATSGRGTVSFSGNYSTCTATVQPTSQNTPRKVTGVDGLSYEIIGTKQVSTVCDIREGNPFSN